MYHYHFRNIPASLARATILMLFFQIQKLIKEKANFRVKEFSALCLALVALRFAINHFE